MEVREVLELSLQTLEMDGWCKNGYRNGEERCIVGALWSVIGSTHDWREGGRTLMVSSIKALAQETGISNLALWNDHPERTFGQVREVFRRAIASAELRELVAA